MNTYLQRWEQKTPCAVTLVTREYDGYQSGLRALIIIVISFAITTLPFSFVGAFMAGNAIADIENALLVVLRFYVLHGMFMTAIASVGRKIVVRMTSSTSGIVVFIQYKISVVVK